MERRVSPSHSSSGSSHDDSPVKHHLQFQLKPQSSSYMMHRSASPVSEDEPRSPRTSTFSPPMTAPVSELSYQHYQHYHRQQQQHQQPSPHLRAHQPRLLPSVSVLVPSNNQVIESPQSQGMSTPRLPPISMLTAAASLQPRMQHQTSSSSASGQQSSEVMLMTRGPPRGGPPPMHPDDQDNLCRYRNKRCGYPRAIKRNGDRHNLCEKHRAKANQNQRKLESKRRTAKKIPATTTTSSPRPGLEQQHHLYQHQQSHQYNTNNSVSTHESLLLAARRERAPSHTPGYPQYRGMYKPPVNHIY